MATLEEIEQGLQQDETFLRLLETDQEKAIQFAEEAMKLADAKPTRQESHDGPVRTFVRPVLEGAGAIGGGVIGAAGGPAGAIAGGVLGGAAGSALSDVVEQAAGEQAPPQSIPEALDNTVENIRSGAIMETGGQALNLAVRGGQKLLKPFSHLIDPVKERVMKTAESLGIVLSPGDITQSKPLAMFVEGIGERTPFSAGIIDRFRMDSLKKLVDRRNELLEKGGTPQAIEETGIRIQERTKELMDELGVTNDAARAKLMDATLQKLGSKESFEALGLNGQDAAKNLLAQESERVGQLYTKAFDLAPPGSKIIPSNTQRTAQELQRELDQLDPALVDPKLAGFVRQFRGSGNKSYDEQQRALAEAMIGVPERVKDRAIREFLGDTPLETPGYAPQDLNKLRARLNTAIDELDAGLRVSGDVGVKGIGKSKANQDRAALLKLKSAIDADVAAFSREQGGEMQGALDVARAAAGTLKSFANSKGVTAFLKAQPQEAARMLAQSKDLQTIRQLKTTMPGAFKGIEEAFANELLGVGREGVIGPAFIRGQLNKFPKGVPEAMLGVGRVRAIRTLATQLETLDSAAVLNPMFQRLLKVNPERVVDLIVKPHNTENIKAIRTMLGQEAVEDLARGMANVLLRKPTRQEPSQEAFLLSPAKLRTGLRDLGDATLKELFKHDPKFLKEMDELIEVANASQGAARLAANPSGTGQSLIAFGEFTMFLFNPKIGASIALGIPAMTKVYLSPIGRKWLTTGLKTNPNSPEAATIIGKILGVATADATVAPEPIQQAAQAAPHSLSVTELALSRTTPSGAESPLLPSLRGAK